MADADSILALLKELDKRVTGELKRLQDDIKDMKNKLDNEILTKKEHKKDCDIHWLEKESCVKNFLYNEFITKDSLRNDVRNIIEDLQEKGLKKANSYVSLINGIISMLGVVIGVYLLKLIGFIR